MVYRFIDENKDYFGLRWLCRRFGISPNCYYNYRKDRKSRHRKKKEIVYEKIKYIYYNNDKTIGYRSMRVFLQRLGIFLSAATVHKYMNTELKLYAVIMRKKPTCAKGKKHKIFDNLINKNFTVSEKNKVWCSDFTYMQHNGKFRFNCTIIDLFDRSVIASINSDKINAELAIATLAKGLREENPGKGLILHTDQGVQYTSKEFTTFCMENGITQSMSKAGHPYDNAPMERYYNTFKNCFFYLHTFKNIDDIDNRTGKFVLWYNHVRPHSTNNYETPMERRYRK